MAAVLFCPFFEKKYICAGFAEDIRVIIFKGADRIRISTDIAQSSGNFRTLVAASDNFDIVVKEFISAKRKCCIFYIEGFSENSLINRLFDMLLAFDDKVTEPMFSAKCIPFGAVELMFDDKLIATSLLSGKAVIFVDGFENAVTVDLRSYPERETAQPEKEKTVRGSKDGFVENIIVNAALIRRRIRSTELRMERFEIGNISQTTVCVCYLADKVDTKLLERIKQKLKEINTPALTMNQQSLAGELLKFGLNPFPKFRYTERVDTTSAQICEGDIAIVVDNSPSVMILPVSIFDIMEEANDYYFPPVTGTYLKLVRYLTAIIVTLLTPIWLLMTQNPDFVPQSLQFTLVDDAQNVPVILQLLILEIVIDAVKLASLNTPPMMTTTFSVVGGIILGDLAIQSGWFATQALFYVAFVAIANFSMPSFELSYALKFMRMITLVLIAFFNLWGFIAGVVLTVFLVVTNKTLIGHKYLFPLIPFNGKKLLQKFFRTRSE